MRDIQNLLTQVSIITKKNAEYLDVTGGRFNMFKILGVNHYETIHSSILAELLNPNGTHGLKSEFLQAFLEMINQDFNDSPKLSQSIRNFDCRNVKVRTEEVIEDGRIDIFIEDNQGHVMIIENKIYAADQLLQLRRYDNFLIKKYDSSNYQIFYLTLFGSNASENSGSNVAYIPISYNKSILLWLERCVNLSSRFPLVRETINQYINHIKKLTNQDMDAKNKEDMIKILSSSEENLQAAFSIFENIGSLKDYIISKYFNPQLREIAYELEILLDKELKGRGIYSGFSFNVPSWNYFHIGFDFEGNDLKNLIYYLKQKDDDTFKNHEDDLYQLVLKLQSKFSFHNANKTIPFGYSNMPGYSNWNTEAFLAIYSGEMKNEIKRIVKNMKEMTEGLEM